MGPLVPYNLISSEFNFIIAIALGIAFGIVLEKAGFGNSRKLAGVFYGYDFVVLRVFFTAAITAISGLIFLHHFGLINLDMVYVNPTFVKSIIVGGIIMGVGFVIGGFCPGTSLVGAATGKIDALFFIGGILIGVFLFAEMYPIFKPIHTANPLGAIKIYHTLGISRGLFVFMLILIALTAFYVTRRIENKVNHVPPQAYSSKRYAFATTAMVIIATIILFLPNREDNRGSLAAAEEVQQLLSDQDRFIHTDELALNLMHHELTPSLVDIRSREEYENFALPGALNIPLEELTDPQWKDYFKDKKEVILYSNSGIITEDALVLLHQAGINNVRILQGGLNEFFALIFEEAHDTKFPDGPIQKLTADTQRFRAHAKEYFQGAKSSGQKRPVVPKAPSAAPVEGGC
ncbi:MAG: hypothetical protein CSA95_06270 [Bacteroidetes bacterium]|nr:MAG: hypothetical protein CSA95_06270 [Bacteroidota bacterium]